jgi:hypothetical protein
MSIGDLLISHHLLLQVSRQKGAPSSESVIFPHDEKLSTPEQEGVNHSFLLSFSLHCGVCGVVISLSVYASVPAIAS